MASFALLLAALGPTGPAQAENGGVQDWGVRSVEGDVTVRRNGMTAWQTVAIGQHLIPGTHIRTGQTGSLRIERNGDRIMMAPGSVLELPAGKGDKSPSGVFQTLGTLLYKIVTRKHNRFLVNTPYMAAVIKGTTFTVTVGDRGTALHVTEGAVQVRSLFTGELGLVRPGQTGEVSATGRRGLTIRQGSRRGRVTPPAGQKMEHASVIPAGVANQPDASSAPILITRTLGESQINIRKVTRGLVVGALGVKYEQDTATDDGDIGANLGSGSIAVGAALVAGGGGTVNSSGSTGSGTVSALGSTVTGVVGGVVGGVTGGLPGRVGGVVGGITGSLPGKVGGLVGGLLPGL